MHQMKVSDEMLLGAPTSPYAHHDHDIASFDASQLATLHTLLADLTQEYRLSITEPALAVLGISSLRAHIRLILNSWGSDLLSTLPSSTASETHLRSAVLESFSAIGLKSLDEATAFLPMLQRYDVYFGTRRTTPAMDGYFLAQSLIAIDRVLREFTTIYLDAHELISLLVGFQEILPSRHLGSSIIEPTSGRSISSSPAEFWSALTPQDVAEYRWRTGHHIFNIFSFECTNRICQASTGHDPNVVAENLLSASRLLRATTAAMWYAESFPPGLYVSHIRPTMVAASQTGSGFSGLDNLEFRYLRRALEQLVGAMSSTFGPTTDWPDELWKAAYTLLDTRVLDLEHHTLLAERVVGNEPSLRLLRQAERTSAQGITADTPAVEALRGLRQLAETNRRSLE